MQSRSGLVTSRSTLRLAAAMAVGLVVATAGQVSAGGVQLDQGFGTGTVLFTREGNEQPRSMAVRPDGRIIVGGASVVGGPRGDSIPTVFQFAANGVQSVAFGFVNGQRQIDVGVDAVVVDLALGASDSIVGVIEASDGPSSFLFRITNTGVVTFQAVDFGNEAERWFSLALQANGAIVLAGYVQPSPTDSRVTAIARFVQSPFGTPDASFGDAGIVVEQVGAATNFALDVAISVAGDRLAVAVFAFNAAIERRVGVLQLLTSDGSPDTSFSTDGKALFSLDGTPIEPGALAFQSNGRIVVAGTTAIPKSIDGDPVVLRIRTTGILDTSFSTDGLAPVSFTGSVQPFAVSIGAGNVITMTGRSDAQDGIAAVRMTSTGALDTTFDGDGRLVTGPPRSELAMDAEVAADGDILVVGQSTSSFSGDADIVLTRILVTGAADAAFGLGGTAQYPAFGFDGEPQDVANGVAVDAIGRVLLAGTVDYTGEPTMQVLRVLPNGYRDALYGSSGNGSGGRVDADFDDAEGTDVVAINNRAVVVGCQACSTAASDMAVAKFTATGTRDNSFSDDGRTIIRFGAPALTERATAVAVDPSGRVVVVGDVGNDIGVARLDADGTPDDTFSNDGIVQTDIETNSVDRLSDVAVQSDGRIVVVGARVLLGASRVAVLRYRTDGVLDSTFSGDGKVVTSFGTTQIEALGVALRPDGRILVAVGIFGGAEASIGVFRYTTAGVLDGTFSGDGRAQFAFAGGDDIPVDVAPAPNDAIVVGGWGGTGQFLAARILAGGTLDASFNGTGFEYAAFDDVADARAMTIEPATGRIVVVGEAAGAEGAYDFAAARFDP